HPDFIIVNDAGERRAGSEWISDGDLRPGNAVVGGFVNVISLCSAETGRAPSKDIKGAIEVHRGKSGSVKEREIAGLERRVCSIGGDVHVLLIGAVSSTDEEHFSCIRAHDDLHTCS